MALVTVQYPALPVASAPASVLVEAGRSGRLNDPAQTTGAGVQTSLIVEALGTAPLIDEASKTAAAESRPAIMDRCSTVSPIRGLQ